MSIQRYTEEPFAAFVKNDDGDFVKYSDHEAELHNLLSTLSDIRAALGVGERPMLGELAGIVGKMKAERDDMEIRLGIIERNTKDDAARNLAQNTLAKIGGQCARK